MSVQQIVDQDFIDIVGHLTDLGLLSEKIVAANDGWND